VEVSLASIFVNGKCLVIQGDIGDVGITIVIEIAKVESHAGDKIAILRKRHASVKGYLFKFISQVMK